MSLVMDSQVGHRTARLSRSFIELMCQVSPRNATRTVPSIPQTPSTAHLWIRTKIVNARWRMGTSSGSMSLRLGNTASESYILSLNINPQ